MGREIDRDAFEEKEYVAFSERLDESLAVVGEVITGPGFGVGPMTIGAELELVLIDAACRPLPSNRAVRLAAADPRVALELLRFNLELNASPVMLAGSPFAALEEELNLLLGRVGQAAAGHGGRVAVIGILPTIDSADLGQAMITDAARYRALGNGLRRLRASSFRIQISGAGSARSGQRRHRGRGRQHVVPGAPAGRARRLRPDLQRCPAGHGGRGGGGRQLPDVPGPPAIGRDQDRSVQAGRGGPARRPAPSARQDFAGFRMAAGRARPSYCRGVRYTSQSCQW